MEETRLGAILLESKIIREEDLERCLEIHALAGHATPLGQILVEERFIDERTLEHLLEVQSARRAPAEIEVEDGRDVERYLAAAMRVGAHELLLSEGRQPLARVAGELRTLDSDPLAGPEVWQFISELMGPQTLETIADRHTVTQDFRRAGAGRGRITAFRHSDGVAVNLRLHPESVRPLAEQPFCDTVGAAIEKGKGLVLLSGERGNGLTEAFASTLHAVAEKLAGRHILVLDDTLEYPAPTEHARVSLRRVGEHAVDYASALRSALATRPDAIFIGDVSDPDAFNLALHAAESGALVVAVLHANSATNAIERAVNLYPEYLHARMRSLLASVVECVVTTRLVPAADCTHYLAACETLRFVDNIRGLVRQGRTDKINLLLRLEDRAHGRAMDGMLMDLVQSGEVLFEDVFPIAGDKGLFLDSFQSSSKESAEGTRHG